MTLLKIDHEFRIRKDMCNVGVDIGQETDVDSLAGNVCVTRLELVNQAAFCLERLYRQNIFLEKLLAEKVRLVEMRSSLGSSQGLIDC